MNDRPMSMPSLPSYPLARLCTLTNILSRVRLTAGVCEQRADVDALPSPGDDLSHPLLRLCTLTNILSRVRLVAGVCEAEVHALPAL